MPTQEPNHYWPFDKMPIEPAKEVDSTPDEQLPGQHVIPFQMSTAGARNGHDFAFEPVFFELDGDGAPKVTSLDREKEINPSVTNQSLGE